MKIFRKSSAFHLEPHILSLSSGLTSLGLRVSEPFFVCPSYWHNFLDPAAKMLQANKASVLTDFHVGSMRVQYLEIEYLLMVFHKITSLSSLLFGFAASALMLSTSLRGGASWLELLHVLCTTSALGFLLLVLLISTLCIMWGPGRALRGTAASSMQQATEVMNASVVSALWLFSVGLLCYLFSSALSMILFQPSYCAIVSVTIISCGGAVLLRTGFEVMHALWAEATTPAAIRGDPLSRVRCHSDAANPEAPAAACGPRGGPSDLTPGAGSALPRSLGFACDSNLH